MDLAIDACSDMPPLATERDAEARALRLAATGDRRAFESLYRLHVGRIHALCLRLCARTDLAEELTQEAFVRAWQRLGSFRGDAAFATWLHRLTVNVVLDHRRAQRAFVRRFVPSDAPDLTDERVEAPSPGDRRDLDAAIRRLPTNARTVFVLHDVEGWQHDEIAERTGIAVGTSKAQLHRARSLLREWLS